MTTRRRIPEPPDGDDEEWMTLFRALPETEVDALLAGQAAPTVAGGLGTVVRVLQLDAARHGAPPMSDALRTQIAHPAPVRVAARRRRVLAGGLGGLLLGGAAMGVAGAQGALPASIQDATAAVAELLGLELPRAAEREVPADGGTLDADAVPKDDGAVPGEEPTSATAEDPSAENPTAEPRAGAPGADPEASPPGPPAVTPGGAIPADPGSPGDHDPATPATPSGGSGSANGSGTDGGMGQDSKASETDRTNGWGTVNP